MHGHSTRVDPFSTLDPYLSPPMVNIEELYGLAIQDLDRSILDTFLHAYKTIGA